MSYTSDESGRWHRTREILPPDDLDLSLSRYGSGFARGLELDGDVLAISAVTVKIQSGEKEDFLNPEEME